MVLARPMQMLWIAAILAVLAATGADAQSSDDVAAANKRVEQLYADAKYAEATPIAEATLALAERLLGAEHPDTLTSVKNLAELYESQGRDAEAEPLFKRALETRERVLGGDHPDTLASVNNLGVFYETRARHSEAEPLLKRALEARERVLGPDNHDTIESVSNLAALYQAQSRFAEAEPLFKRAFEASERAFGGDNPDTLLSLNDLAVFYQLSGRAAEAVPLMQRCVEASERVLGAEHPDTLSRASKLALLYFGERRYAEAETLLKRTIEAQERVLGKDDAGTLASVDVLAQLYRAQGAHEQAEPLLKRVLEARERLLGKDHLDTLRGVDDLAGLYLAQRRYAEAEPLLQRSVEIREHLFGRDDANTLAAINSLAGLYDAEGRYSLAEPLYARALEARERGLGKEHPDTLLSMSSLARALFELGRYSEAEPLMKRVLEISEGVLGQDAPNTLARVNDLGVLYRIQRRYGEAEPLYRRALDSFERTRGPEDPATIISVNNLAEVYVQQGRYGEAEPLLKRALDVNERTLGKDNTNTLVSVVNLAGLYNLQGRYGEAEPLDRRAYDTFARVLGKEHPTTLVSANNLAGIYRAEGRYAEAEPLYRRTVEASERVLGAEHPQTVESVNELAELYFAKGDWTRAAQFWRRSTAAIIQRTLRGVQTASQGLSGSRQSEAEQASGQFRALVKAVRRLAAARPDADRTAASETFQTAQWALSSEAARSLAQMAARGAKGDPSLASLARERQDLVAEWQTRDASRNAALGEASDKRDAQAEAENLARLAAIDARIAEIDKRLTTEFPDYAALSTPLPLSVKEVQAQLRANEALVLFLDTDASAKPTPEETFVWVVTKTKLRWVRSSLGSAALTREVQALRCGLDEEEWATPTDANRCGGLLGLAEAPDPSRPLPFHLGKAYALYEALFGEVEDVIAGKRLLIVPSGALTSLPFQVLVTEKPARALPKTFTGYRDVAWLGRKNAITTLPAVSSLKALRQHAANRQPGAEAYAGYGDPLLSGDASCSSAKAPTACPTTGAATKRAASSASRRATVRGRGGRRSATLYEVFAKGSAQGVLLAEVRSLCPLPDTAYEIKCVAERFDPSATLIRLEGQAKETDIKALSESGQLARYRILHFATHGLLSGDVEKMALRQGEPALVLTPPDKPANADDDGLLMASEITALKLNADWVVLSACNTAAGNETGGQALSGLARAFFYAGGRALMVSHWPVYSDAAVRLTTSAFAELERNPKAGRAEALQSAMIALMDDRSQSDNAHPAVWAPFVVVGEGGVLPARATSAHK